MLLSIGLLLFGGGIFPPLIGIVRSVVGAKINTPLKSESGPFWRLLAKVWPPAAAITILSMLARPVSKAFNFVRASLSQSFTLR